MNNAYRGFELRRSTREPIRLEVVLRAYRMTPAAAWMMDISAGGAMLSVAGDGLAHGDEIIDCPGLEVVATIAWIRPGFCGVTFHRQLQDVEVRRLRERAR